MLPGKKYTPLDYARMALRRKWFIIVPVVIAGYVSLVISSRLQEMYRSEMLIQVVPQRVPDAYVRSTVTLRTEERLNALQQQVLSRTELERLIQQLDLYGPERERLPMQDVVELMRLNIGVDAVRSQARDADAFYVRFTYRDRDVVARVAERLGALFIEMNARDRGDLAQATNNFMQSQLIEARQRLETQERTLEQFRQMHAGRLPSQLDSNMQAINRTQLEVQNLADSLARDRDRKLMLEQMLTEAEAEVWATARQAPTPVNPPLKPQADPSAPTGGTPEEQLAAAREVLARLQITRRPEHPDVTRIKRTIEELERRVADDAALRASAEPPPTESLREAATPDQAARRERLRQMRADVESLERQIVFKESAEVRLRNSIAEYQKRVEQAPGLESEWVALTRDYDTTRDSYRALLAKSEESKVAAELEKRQIGEQFRVLDPARPPVRPVGIDRMQLNAMGLAVGLALGLAVAGFLEFRDSTYRNAGDVLEVLDLPVLAMVPYVPIETDRRRSRRLRLMFSGVVALFVAVAGYGMWALQLWKHIR